MSRPIWVAVLCIAPISAIACVLENSQRIVGDDGVVLLYRLETPPLVVAQHFALQFRVCRGDETLAVDRFRLDATMPAHRHGMNYFATVEKRENGVVEARGLLFHMPGHWRVDVDFDHRGKQHEFGIDFRI